MAEAINPREWIEIGHVAVRTRSVSVAARVAARVKQTRQDGEELGVEYVCLAIFRERLAAQRAVELAVALEEGKRCGKCHEIHVGAECPEPGH
jgi:hypothetical protein